MYLFRCNFSSCSESTEIWHAYSYIIAMLDNILQYETFLNMNASEIRWTKCFRQGGGICNLVESWMAINHRDIPGPGWDGMCIIVSPLPRSVNRPLSIRGNLSELNNSLTKNGRFSIALFYLKPGSCHGSKAQTLLQCVHESIPSRVHLPVAAFPFGSARQCKRPSKFSEYRQVNGPYSYPTSHRPPAKRHCSRK